jgi:Cu2+-exporting ATPase
VRADYLASGLAQLLAEEPPARDDPNARVRFWHLVNRNYAVAVLLASALGGLLWWFLDPSQALPVAVSVLVITCPCAMGIATPLAFHLALAALRRRGVFVRARDLLERVRSVRKVVFDKTGTVTFGGLCARPIGDVPEAALPALATMAASSNHPVSQAVLQALPRTPFVAGLHVDEVVGRGLECGHDGARWRLGSRAFASGIDSEDDAGDRRECVLSRDGRVVATFALEEDFRAGAAGEIETLQRRGLAVHLLSGDRPDRVQRAAARLGIAPDLARGGMSPEDKAAAVRALDARDTMMVGDGLNDAPAFAAAFCAGTPAMDRPVLPARADFFFRGAQAGAVASLFAFADRHARVVRTNVALAVTYNAGALALCFAAAMTPGLCAVLMPLSSLALVLHTSLRMGARRQA